MSILESATDQIAADYVRVLKRSRSLARLKDIESVSFDAAAEE